jgi:hypothetical protein
VKFAQVAINNKQTPPPKKKSNKQQNKKKGGGMKYLFLQSVSHLASIRWPRLKNKKRGKKLTSVQ